ncbi:MAG TPA: galactokinase family protein [Acidimicrobiales bacterium]|nr:galactokinase family protein [Acidimicrobiales bacterium]
MARLDRTVVARAPGRVNLVGDHTDYNQGLALPMAIDLATEVTVRLGPHAGTPGWLALTSTLDGGTARIPVPEGTPLPAGAPPWATLAAVVVAQVHPADGGTGRVTSTVPTGAGLSSSAAFTVALARALGTTAPPAELARTCRRAESAVGADVGLMDPLVIAAATAGQAMLIDFADLSTVPVPVPADLAVVVVHSGQPRLLAGGDRPYAARRAECDAAARQLGRPLGRATEADVAAVTDPVLRRRARHVVTECRRVREMADALRRHDLAAAGQVMAESHRSLAGDFAASTPAVDALVDDLDGRPGVFGARMTGGGFGGCVVALAGPGAVDPAEWPGRAWLVTPSGGATVHATGGGR